MIPTLIVLHEPRNEHQKIDSMLTISLAVRWASLINRQKCSIKLPGNLLETALLSPYQPLHQRSMVQSPLFLNYWYYINWGEQTDFMDVDELFPSAFIIVLLLHCSL